MQTATITVQYVNPPRGRGPGSVKDTTGIYWKVWADKLPAFHVGGSYAIGYDTELYQGKQTFTVKEVMPLNESIQSPGSSQGIAGGGVPVAPRAGVPIPPPASIRPEDQKRSEDIAVLAIVKEWVSQIPVGDLQKLTEALRVARVAWRNSGVLKKADAPADDMNDEIPF